jgi:hypothetical protein
VRKKRGDLREKYGAADAHGRFLVRPGIGMTAEFGQDGQVREMLIKRLDSEDESNGGRSTVMSSAVAKEILEEVAPVARRGKLGKKSAFVSGCTHIAVDEYEHMSIGNVTRCEAQGGGTYSATVHWK